MYEETNSSAETDFSMSNIFNRNNENKSSKVVSKGPAPDAEEYNMNHTHRGIALVFNHLTFSELPSREGTNLDRDRICTVLRQLEFDIAVHNDLKAAEIDEVLLTVSKMDHSTSDCLVVVVMTHGDDRILHAKDKSYPTKRLWQYFDAHYCPSLTGKPKLFFLQACRGENFDKGATISYTETDSKNSSECIYSIPIMADVLIMYSAVEGFVSWRDVHNGSFFIQVLANELEKYARNETRDLLSILTIVNRKVATGYGISNLEIKNSNYKQMCSIVSMLTRFVYFNRK